MSSCETAASAAARTELRAVDSLSFARVLEGDPQHPRALNYTEAFFPNFTPDPLTGGPPPGYVGVHHAQAARDLRFKLIRRVTRSAAGLSVSEQMFDLAGDGAASPPDFFEQFDPLAVPLSPGAAAAYVTLAAVIDAHPPVVR